MKICILNGGYQVLVNVVELLLIEIIIDVIVDFDIQVYFCKVQIQEILFYVVVVLGIILFDYLVLIERWFLNLFICDIMWCVVFDGLLCYVGFILLVVWDVLEKGGLIIGLVLVEVLWVYMCVGVCVDGLMIELNDFYWDSLFEVVCYLMMDLFVWLVQM